MDSPSRKSTEQQKLSHSGDLELEFPEVGVPKLSESFNQNPSDADVVNLVPNNIEGVNIDAQFARTNPANKDTFVTNPNTTLEKEAPKRGRKGLIAGLGIGTVALVTGAVIAGNMILPKGDTEGTGPEKEPTNNGQVVEDPEVETPVETETPTFTTEIPTGLETNELSTVIVEGVISDFINAGTNEELRQKVYDADGDRTAVSQEVATENAKAFADKYLVDDWENIPNLVNFMESLTQSNATTVEWYAATEWNTEDPENIEGYTEHLLVNGSREVPKQDASSTDRQLVIDIVSENNSLKNSHPDMEPSEAQLVVTVKPDGANDRISDIFFQ